MDQNVAQLYQSALQTITKVSGFLNLFRAAGTQPDRGNVLLNTTGQNPVGAELKQQLQSNAPFPTKIAPSFTGGLPSLFGDSKDNGAGALLGLIGGVARLPVKITTDILKGNNPLDDILELPTSLLQWFTNLFPGSLQLPFVIANQVEIALSVLPSIHMFQNAVGTVGKIEEALEAYFFTAEGYQTIDGDTITRPDLTKVAAGDLTTIKSLVSQKAAADYVRNSVRITIDAGADEEYNLRNRLNTAYGLVWLNPTQANKDRLVAWMKGFASMAESAATSAVEAAILGAGAVQTNSVIGAAAGTAAGTMARKATQDVYLTELGATR
ncbi:MAG: hypothetical protein ABSD31_20080 [Candidatus Binataceae bacterium]|jgi:hypothetical protein